MISVHGGWWIPLLILALLFWRPWRWGRRAHYQWYGWPPPRHHMPPDRAPELDENVRARLELARFCGAAAGRAEGRQSD
jgi:hypothetical protein